MEEIAFTYEEIVNKELLVEYMTAENIAEIIQTIKRTVKYLTNYTLIFLQKINGRWYVN